MRAVTLAAASVLGRMTVGQDKMMFAGIGVGSDISGKFFSVDIVADNSKQAVLMDRGTNSTISGDSCPIK